MCRPKVYYTPDTTSPVVSSIVRVDPDPTNDSPDSSVHFTVTFSETVTGVGTADFALNTTGAVSGAHIHSVSGSGAIYTVTVHIGSGDGTIRLDVDDDDTIIDGANNKLGGTGIDNGNFTTGEFYTIDRTKPAVTINQAAGQADPTSSSPINFDVVFNEPVSASSFTSADVTVTYTGVGMGTTKTKVITGSGATYNVAVSGMDASGTVDVAIAAGKVLDLADNSNTVSTSTDNIVTYNFPTYTITPSAGAGGTITPPDAVVLDEGDDQTFTIVPSAGYIVSDVLVDGGSVDKIDNYIFNNVITDHTISAIFDDGWRAPSGSSGNFSNPDRAYTSNNSRASATNGEEQIYKNFSLGDLTNTIIEGITVGARGTDQ